MQPHQSTARPLERAPNHIKVTRPSSSFIPVAAMGECKQINNSNLLYVSDVISLIIHERITRFRSCCVSYLSIMIYDNIDISPIPILNIELVLNLLTATDEYTHLENFIL